MGVKMLRKKGIRKEESKQRKEGQERKKEIGKKAINRRVERKEGQERKAKGKMEINQLKVGIKKEIKQEEVVEKIRSQKGKVEKEESVEKIRSQQRNEKGKAEGGGKEEEKE